MMCEDGFYYWIRTVHHDEKIRYSQMTTILKYAFYLKHSGICEIVKFAKEEKLTSLTQQPYSVVHAATSRIKSHNFWSNFCKLSTKYGTLCSNQKRLKTTPKWRFTILGCAKFVPLSIHKFKISKYMTRCDSTLLLRQGSFVVLDLLQLNLRLIYRPLLHFDWYCDGYEPLVTQQCCKNTRWAGLQVTMVLKDESQKLINVRGHEIENIRRETTKFYPQEQKREKNTR